LPRRAASSVPQECLQRGGSHRNPRYAPAETVKVDLVIDAAIDSLGIRPDAFSQPTGFVLMSVIEYPTGSDLSGAFLSTPPSISIRAEPSPDLADLGMRFRLRGARLVAGMIELEQVVLAVGLPVAAWELGDKAPTASELAVAARLYGVSIAYLSGDPATSVREAAAHELAVILRRVDRGGPDEGNWANRLVRIEDRTDLDKDEVGASLSHLVLQFVPHLHREVEHIPLDNQIAYALAFKANPAYAVFGTLPVSSRHNLKLDDWKVVRPSELTLMAIEARHAAAAEVAVVRSERSSPWSWLRQSVGPAFVRIPLLDLSDGRFRQAKSPLLLPLSMLPQSFGAKPRKLFGLRCKDAVAVIDPSARTGEVLFVSTTGGLERRESGRTKVRPVDPFTIAEASEVLHPIGTTVAVITIHVRDED
jgi:hypothetical protein